MSELEKIVDHIVQHEEKRQAEKIKLESEIKALEEVLEHGISTKFVENEVIYVYSPKTAHDMREKLEENYKQLHAQLTIPKSIAEMADKQETTKLKFDDYDNEFFPYFKWSTEFDKQHGKFSSSYLLEAYLNPLTRDLVKVVEG